jgi:hypothetical protein
MMSPSANVLSIQKLEDLRSALGRFGGEAQEALNATAQELQRTFEWLRERQTYWQAEVRRQQEVAERARRALAACQSSGSYDSRTGRTQAPNCSAQENALLQAQVRLREAEAELRNIQDWTRLIQQAAADYQRQAQRLAAMLNNELFKATASLGRSASTLRSYATMSQLASAVTVMQSPSDLSMPIAPSPSMSYALLGDNVDGKYDKETNTILINENYRDIHEQALLDPLIAHEAVHAKYKSEDPHDEISLQAYVAEEIEAYKAQLEAWLQVEEDFYQRYPTPKSREALGMAGGSLLEAHLNLKEIKWDEFHKKLEHMYRPRL